MHVGFEIFAHQFAVKCGNSIINRSKKTRPSSST
jgi:predicted RNA-binding Zn-ribbon protein involved in translation (DUF1610 family)